MVIGERVASVHGNILDAEIGAGLRYHYENAGEACFLQSNPEVGLIHWQAAFNPILVLNFKYIRIDLKNRFAFFRKGPAGPFPAS